mmetsp:Transcript_50959/g.116105  ORF Transcript_50959/g.116105 Transcript_50959/m.116105 type:complete len:143 (+) Transcript_50959:122-550(+)
MGNTPTRTSWFDFSPAFNAGDVAVCLKPAATAKRSPHHSVSASTLGTKSPRRSTKSPRHRLSGESEKTCAVLAVHCTKPEVQGDGAQALAARSKIDEEEAAERARMRSRAARAAVVKANANLLALNVTPGNTCTRRKSYTGV